MISNTELTDHNKIQSEIKILTNLILKKGDSKTSQINAFLDKVKLSKLSFNEISEYEKELAEKELLKSLLSMQNNKSPGNDELTKEFFCKILGLVHPSRKKYLTKASFHKTNCEKSQQ